MSEATVHTTYLPCVDLDATTDFYRSVLKRDGVWASRSEYVIDLGGSKLACARMGGHELAPSPLALVLSVTHLPSLAEIEGAGGRRADYFPFAVPTGESTFATDPSGNAVCFVRTGEL